MPSHPSTGLVTSQERVGKGLALMISEIDPLQISRRLALLDSRLMLSRERGVMESALRYGIAKNRTEEVSGTLSHADSLRTLNGTSRTLSQHIL